jgi:ATP-dependent DNA helicase RecG
MHRDWFIDGANVFVEIHADRIEVVSPGGLPPGLPEDQLGRKSVRRNPIIADLLQRIRFIERAGTGIGRMRDELVAHGSPEPVFESKAFFTARFRPLREKEFEGLDDPPDFRGHDRGHEMAQGLGHDRSHGTADSSDEALSVAELAILEACRDGAVTRDHLMRAGGFTGRSGNFRRTLSNLMALGLVEMTRPDAPRSRSQRYRLTEKGRTERGNRD